MTSGVSVKSVAGASQCGEGPHWEETTNSLVYVDIRLGMVHRYFPSTGTRTTLTIGQHSTGNTISFVLPTAADPDVLLVGHGRNVTALEWQADSGDLNGARSIKLATVDEGLTTRFNDGKCDPSGRVWAGTMGAELEPNKFDMGKGSLYRFNDEMVPSATVDKISISNGLTWSNDKKIFFYIDSLEYKVEAFDYDDNTGDISNRRTVLDYHKEGLKPDLPDGMTTDVDGNLWVANYSGSKVIQLDPSTGKLLRTLNMPVQNITSVGWGGKDYSILYVTSAAQHLTQEEIEHKPLSGNLFEVTGLGTKGLPPTPAILNDKLLKKIKASLAEN